jgi:hypothetical protein
MGEDGGGPPRRPSGDAKRVRRPGGGRPKATQRQAGLEQAFTDILDAHSAGSPTDPCVRWTDLNPSLSVLPNLPCTFNELEFFRGRVGHYI